MELPQRHRATENKEKVRRRVEVCYVRFQLSFSLFLFPAFLCASMSLWLFIPREAYLEIK